MQNDMTTATGYQASRSSFDQQTTSARQSEIGSEFQGLRKNIEELTGQVSLLEDKLISVLSRQAKAGSASAPTSPDIPMAPLAEAIRDEKRRVAAIGAMVAAIIDRLELPE